MSLWKAVRTALGDFTYKDRFCFPLQPPWLYSVIFCPVWALLSCNQGRKGYCLCNSSIRSMRRPSNALSTFALRSGPPTDDRGDWPQAPWTQPAEILHFTREPAQGVDHRGVQPCSWTIPYCSQPQPCLVAQLPAWFPCMVRSFQMAVHLLSVHPLLHQSLIHSYHYPVFLIMHAKPLPSCQTLRPHGL